MKDNLRESRILIIDDDLPSCHLLETLLTLWGMIPESRSDTSEAMNRIREVSFNVVLLDVRINGKPGTGLIPEIKAQRPGAKVIVMTGYADKETTIEALRLGAFDFLEKPFAAEILSHSIDRALQAIERERSVKVLIEDLKSSREELLNSKEQLEDLNSQLLETNRALTILARNIERQKEQSEKQIAIKLRSLIIPTIERLSRDKDLLSYEMELSMLVEQLKDFTSGFGAEAAIASKLSFTELRIASLVKNGLTSDQIADMLYISPTTVRTHRKNIRKKLKINSSQFSLRSFLISREAYREEVIQAPFDQLREGRMS